MRWAFGNSRPTSSEQEKNVLRVRERGREREREREALVESFIVATGGDLVIDQILTLDLFVYVCFEFFAFNGILVRDL